MSDKVTLAIDACAKVAEDAAGQLDAMLKSDVRGTAADRLSRKQLIEARRWAKRIAADIRALNPEKTPKKTAHADKEAHDALRELRPLIAATTRSPWRTHMLARIDKIIG